MDFSVSSSIMIMLATFHAVFLHGKLTFSSHPRPTIAISDQKTRMLLLFLRSVPTHKKVLIHTRLWNVRTPDFLPPSAICTFHPIFFPSTLTEYHAIKFTSRGIRAKAQSGTQVCSLNRETRAGTHHTDQKWPAAPVNIFCFLISHHRRNQSAPRIRSPQT